MAMRPNPRQERPRLSRQRVLECAMTIADTGGLSALTMRSLAKELNVKPMALYHYFATKDEILDGLVDLVFAAIELPNVHGQWREEIRRRAHSARQELGRHPWAIALLESRTIQGPATLQHHETMIATLRTAGFSPRMTAHAYALIDSYVYGFAVQEAALPYPRSNDAFDKYVSAEQYPYLVELAHEHVLRPNYDFGTEFKFGLDVILDGLMRRISDTDDTSGLTS